MAGRHPKHPFRRRIERFLTRCVATVFASIMRAMPLSWCRRLGNLGGPILYVISGRRQRLADDNLIATFGDRFSAGERKKIRTAVAANTVKMIYELFKMPTLSPEMIREAVPVEGVEHMHRALSRGKGAILVTAHYGNWEMAGARMAAEGFNMGVVARDASDAHVASMINKCREDSGLHVFGRDDLKSMLTHLRNNGVLAILADQHASEGAIRVEFLDRPAWSARGPAMLALRTGCAVVPGFSVREADDSLKGYILEELEVTADGDREDAVVEVTQRINDVIGEQIRKRPEQWLWFHNRWKELPPDIEKADPE